MLPCLVVGLYSPMIAAALDDLTTCQESATPNITLFLIDDMGWQDASAQFHSKRTVWNDLYRTPNMQRLAKRGMKFTNAYTAHPVRSRTRFVLIFRDNIYEDSREIFVSQMMDLE